MRCNSSFRAYYIVVAIVVVVAGVATLRLLISITPAAFLALNTLNPRIDVAVGQESKEEYCPFWGYA